MEKRKLGNTDLMVAPLCFGGNVFGWTVDEPTSFELLDAFEAGGFNFIDTADVYSRWVPEHEGGESETIIGNWMKQKNNRAKMIVATKVGGDMGEGKNLRRDYILKACEASLKRLQTDYIDLYQTHWDDETIRVEEIMESYARLVKEGKVRWIGASNMRAERLKDSLTVSEQLGYPRYQTLQPQYNLYDREGFEKELKGICEANNIGVITYYSLASGFLTGKYRSEEDFSKSVRGGGMQKFMNPRGFKILEALDKVSERLQTTPATVALAWLMAQSAVAAPIASATKLDQLNALMKAPELKLDDAALKLLDEASAWQ